MKSQKGEVVTGVMVVMMAGMMIFGMFYMHGGHGSKKDHPQSKEQKHSETGLQHMSHGDSDKAAVSDIDGEEKK